MLWQLQQGNTWLTRPISLEDINKNCLEQFRMHWMCLENNNHQMWWCRQPEKALNKCVFDKLVRKPT